MNEERISKQQLEKLYGVNRMTVENWIKFHNLPMIIINSHSKFVRLSDLLEWEDKMKEKSELQL